ncbi:MAG: hypothetical protein P1U89_03770 [Verrucomicrobiales bacterium]|nr:hypothetical protein [Verrucomicrobiales bacterium]
MKKRHWKVLLLLSILLFGSNWSYAEKNVLNRKYDSTSFVKVDHLFDEHVKSGFHPYKVTIRNGYERPLTWTIRFDTNASNYRYQTSHQIRVEAGAEAVEELIIPAPPTKGHRYSNYRNVRVSATAPGLENEYPRSISGSVDPNWPAIVMSKNLARRNLSRLSSVRKEQKRGQDYFASSFNELPSNWKGLTCVDILMIDDASWRALPKQQKRAAMTWVRYGGRLEVFAAKQDATFEDVGFEEPDFVKEKKGTFSLGTVTINHWNGKDLPDQLVNRYAGSRQFDNSFNQDFSKSWGLLDDFGTKNFNPFLVFILLVIFAVLVGPINLFHFAKAGQRHRLFITTPIISLVASLVIIFIILVQDGMGGNGRRVVFVDVQSDPEQRQLQLLQHQVSRTGVMLRSGFDNEATPGVIPVNLPPSRWNPINNGQFRNSNYQFNQGSYSGDFFRSRSEQGFHLRAVRPTRSRIERRGPEGGGEVPNLFSSMEFAVTNFFYIDLNGIVWKTAKEAPVEPGQEIQLEKSDIIELTEWLNDVTNVMAEADQRQIRNLKSSRQRYFAIAKTPTPLMIDTHSAIRWKQDFAIVSGMTVEP